MVGLLAKNDLNLKELSDTICTDPAFAAEVLRVVNSALFALSGKVASVLQAIALLGLARVRGLAFTVAMRRYMQGVLSVAVVRRCWRHSLASALLSEDLAGGAMMDGGECYTLGLLHDVGRIALAVAYPAEYARLLEVVDDHDFQVLAAERDLFDIDHCQAGRWVVQQWGLPEIFWRVAGGHHEAHHRPWEREAIVHAACRLANAIGFSVCYREEIPLEEALAAVPEPDRSRLQWHSEALRVRIGAAVLALDPF